MTGLKAYINRASTLLLLYPQERAQAEEVCPEPCLPLYEMYPNSWTLLATLKEMSPKP